MMTLDSINSVLLKNCRKNWYLLEWLATKAAGEDGLTRQWLCKKRSKLNMVLEVWRHLWAHTWCQAKAHCMHPHYQSSGSLYCLLCSRYPSVVPTQQLEHRASASNYLHLCLELHISCLMIFTIIYIIENNIRQSILKDLLACKAEVTKTNSISYWLTNVTNSNSYLPIHLVGIQLASWA